jgi:hypothetical protein
MNVRVDRCGEPNHLHRRPQQHRAAIGRDHSTRMPTVVASITGSMSSRSSSRRTRVCRQRLLDGTDCRRQLQLGATDCGRPFDLLQSARSLFSSVGDAGDPWLGLNRRRRGAIVMRSVGFDAGRRRRCFGGLGLGPGQAWWGCGRGRLQPSRDVVLGPVQPRKRRTAGVRLGRVGLAQRRVRRRRGRRRVRFGDGRAPATGLMTAPRDAHGCLLWSTARPRSRRSPRGAAALVPRYPEHSRAVFLHCPLASGPEHRRWRSAATCRSSGGG